MNVRETVATAVGSRLGLPAAGIDPARPLALYGLDSLAASEIVFDLEDRLGQPIPEWLLHDNPTLDAVVSALTTGAPREDAELALMRADAVLPADVRPGGIAVSAEAGWTGSRERVLLTGATGFLGGFLLRRLLDDGHGVTCLVRGRDGLSRIARNLQKYALRADDLDGRVEVIDADVAEPGLGLDEGTRVRLARTCEVIFHVAADVNWSLPYPGLRAPNVLGTLELLRLACAERPSRFHFVSSLSVAYATRGGDAPVAVDESGDALAWIDRLPLGYARSKAVAEALVRQAATRGLDATVFRPPLITGDATTGASNPDDLIARLVRACVELGAAPDLDWTVDAMPVDYVARALVRLAGRGPATWHLTNRRPRHWRECVLWMNLAGYPCALVPFREWQRRIDRPSLEPAHPLHGLRPFFLRSDASGLTAPERYEDERRATIVAATTHAAEREAGLDCPSLSADLLDRYFADYAARGVLPARPLRGRGDAAQADGQGGRPGADEPGFFLDRFARATRHRRGASASEVALISRGSEHSILGELTAWRHGRHTGLSVWRADIDLGDGPRRRDVVMKVKPADTLTIEVGTTVAHLCDAALGQAFAAHSDRVGLAGGHRREPALYALTSGVPALARWMPECLGTWAHADDGEWGVLLERLDDLALIDATDSGRWSTRHREAAVDGLSALHAAWLPHVDQVAAADWIGHVVSAGSAAGMTPLWRALAAHARGFESSMGGANLVRTHAALIDTLPRWWPALERGPQTLLHGDCNPRNLALRRDGDGFRLCAYDWELATIGAPARDLAELLCFILPAATSAPELWALVDRHRDAFASAGHVALDDQAWRSAFRAALADVLVRRLAFYVMIDRVRPQRFLPRVVATWQRLFALAGGLEELGA